MINTQGTTSHTYSQHLAQEGSYIHLEQWTFCEHQTYRVNFIRTDEEEKSLLITHELKMCNKEKLVLCI